MSAQLPQSSGFSETFQILPRHHPPAKTGIQKISKRTDSRLRGNDSDHIRRNTAHGATTMNVHLGTISPRPCRICGTIDNPIVASEKPCALWGGRPWMPEGHYTTICCRMCGNHYVDSDVTERYIDDLMGSFIPEKENMTTYDSTEEGDKIRTFELSQHWEIITKLRRPIPNDKLLDYGCAWGALGNIAKQAGCIPNGIELQPAGAAFSLKLWGRESVVHRGPIETAPFGDSTFQYITSFETLEHVFDPIRILTIMKRLLKDDGIIAISVPSADYFSFKYWVYRKQPFNAWIRKRFPGNMVDNRVLIHNHLNTFSLESAKLMMKQAGLRVIFISPYCSGLSGGRLGHILKFAGKLLWMLSFERIVLAPSIFIVAEKHYQTTAY